MKILIPKDQYYSMHGNTSSPHVMSMDLTCKTANNISKCKINVSDNKPKNSDKALKHLLTPLEADNFEDLFSIPSSKNTLESRLENLLSHVSSKSRKTRKKKSSKSSHKKKSSTQRKRSVNKSKSTRKRRKATSNIDKTIY